VIRELDLVQVHLRGEISRPSSRIYGKPLPESIASSLTAAFGMGFEASNFRYKPSQFANALRHELSWTQIAPFSG
jgi:hypothetical protein